MNHWRGSVRELYVRVRVTASALSRTRVTAADYCENTRANVCEMCNDRSGPTARNPRAEMKNLAAVSEAKDHSTCSESFY